MKRSDMVKFMANEWRQYCRDNDSTGSIWEACDHVLKKMEEKGMLSPPNPGVYDLVPTVTPTGNHEYSWKREWTVESDFAQSTTEDLRGLSQDRRDFPIKLDPSK